MSALLLSFLYLFMDPRKTDLGAGDLAVDFGNTGLSTPNSVDYTVTHKLHTDIYNELTNASLPAFSFKIPDFYLRPNSGNIYILGVDYRLTLNLLSDFKNLLPESIRNYHYLWHTYIKGESKVQIFCQFKTRSCKDYDDFFIPTNEGTKNTVMTIKKNNSKGILLEGEVFGPPCRDDKLIKTFKLKNLCDFMKAISKKPLPILSMLKYSKQSPVYVETKEEYSSIFGRINESLRNFGYPYENKIQVRERPNAFVALCSFHHKLGSRNFEDCNLFFRSFTNMGIGYTAYSEVASKLFKSKHFGGPEYFTFPNNQINPIKMISAGSNHALRVFIENNREEVDVYENTKEPFNPNGQLKLKPKEKQVSMHNPLEPANIRNALKKTQEVKHLAKMP